MRPHNGEITRTKSENSDNFEQGKPARPPNGEITRTKSEDSDNFEQGKPARPPKSLADTDRGELHALPEITEQSPMPFQHNEQATAQDISTVLLNSLHGKDANRYPATVAHLCHPTDPTAPQGENSKAVLYLDSLCGGNLISEHLLRSFEDETGAHHSRHRSYTTYGPPSQENALVPAYSVDLHFRLQDQTFVERFDVLPLHGKTTFIAGIPFWTAHNVTVGYVDGNITIVLGEQPLDVLEPDDVIANLDCIFGAMPDDIQMKLILPQLHDVDVNGEQLLMRAEQPMTLSTADQAKLDNLIEEYNDVFTPRTGLPPIRVPGEAASIDLIPGSTPPYRPAIRMNHIHEQAARELIDDLLQRGLIVPTQSAFSSPLFMVEKVNSKGEVTGFRGVVDYRALNALSRKMGFPLPRIDRLLSELAGSSIFSTLDLQDGFYQLRLRPEDSDKSTIITPFGQYRFLVLPMGVASGPAWFSKLVARVFKSEQDCAVTYLDDICIHSDDNMEAHFANIRRIFDRCRTENLQLKRSKCSFFCTQVHYLGHVVTAGRISMLTRHTHRLLEEPLPRTKGQLAAWLGLANYYRAFAPMLSALAAPLLPHGTKRKSERRHPVPWTPQMRQAFLDIKNNFRQDRELYLFKPDRQTRIRSDASSTTGCGAVLEQYVGKEDTADSSGWVPCSFYSHKWIPAEASYPIYEQELLGVKLALMHWFHLLYGREVTIYVDNQAILWYQQKPFAQLSKREQRWLQALTSFQPLQIYYLPGSTNIAADLLSREMEPPVCFSILDCYAGSASFLRALQMLWTRMPTLFSALDHIDYQCLEHDPAKRELLKRVHTALFKQGIPLTPDPFRLGQQCCHGVDTLVAMLQTPSGKALTADLANVDFLMAGPPCQGVSQRGQNLGDSDPRSGFHDICLLKTHVPADIFYAVENVPGILHHPEIHQRVREAFPGYHSCLKLLGAQDRHRMVYTNLRVEEQKEMVANICKAANIPLTWQQALDIATPPGGEPAQAPTTYCPTLVTVKRNDSERNGKQLVSSQGVLRPMTMEERVAVVGLHPGDTGKRPTLSRQLTGNAIPVPAYGCVLWAALKAWHTRLLQRNLQQAEAALDTTAQAQQLNHEDKDEPVQLAALPNCSSVCQLPGSQNDAHPEPPTTELSLADQVFQIHRRNGHPGVNRTYSLCQEHGIVSTQKEIRELLQTCDYCQRSGRYKLAVNRESVLPLPHPAHSFSEVQIDECVDLPESPEGFDAFVCLSCMWSGYIVAFPFRKDDSAQTLLLRLTEFVSYFGVPRCMWVDSGSRFTAKIFEQFCSRYGITQKVSCPHRKHTQGLVERSHRIIQDRIKAELHEHKHPPTRWYEHMAGIIISSNNLPRLVNGGFSPSQLTFGRNLATTWPPANSLLQKWTAFQAEVGHLKEHQHRLKQSNESAPAEPQLFHPGDEVLLKVEKRKLALSYVGPFTVVTERAANHGYTVKSRTRRLIRDAGKLTWYHRRALLLHDERNKWRTKPEVLQQIRDDLCCSFHVDLTCSADLQSPVDGEKTDNALWYLHTHAKNLISWQQENKESHVWLNPPYTPSANAGQLLVRILLKLISIGLRAVLLIPVWMKELVSIGVKTRKIYKEGSTLFTGHTQTHLLTRWPVHCCTVLVPDDAEAKASIVRDLLALINNDLLEDTVHDEACMLCREIATTDNFKSFVDCEGCTHTCCLTCLRWDTADDHPEWWCPTCLTGNLPTSDLARVFRYLLVHEKQVLVRGEEENYKAVYWVVLDDVVTKALKKLKTVPYKGKQTRDSLIKNGFSASQLERWPLQVLPGYDSLEVMRKQSKYPVVQTVLDLLA